MSNYEYQQQKEWREQLKLSMFDDLILGESCLHVSKEGIKRIDPFTPEYQAIYNILEKRIEEELMKTKINNNKTYLPEGYENKK